MAGSNTLIRDVRMRSMEGGIWAMKTTYPIMLVSGFACLDLYPHGRFGRIPQWLEEWGNTVFTGKNDAFGTIESNACLLGESLKDILEATGKDKINLIAFSKGGLDARYLISKTDQGKHIASLTTLATPHYGVDLATYGLDVLPRWTAKAVAWFPTVAGHLYGDANPNAYQAIQDLTEKSMRAFNSTVRNIPEVYYQSFAFSSAKAPKRVFGKYVGRQNDGLVNIESAQWGDFKGYFMTIEDYIGSGKAHITHKDICDQRTVDFSLVFIEDGTERPTLCISRNTSEIYRIALENLAIRRL